MNVLGVFCGGSILRIMGGTLTHVTVKKYIKYCIMQKIMKGHVTNGSVFDDLDFTSTEAASLKIRAVLMRAIEQELVRRKLTQAKAAKILCITQPRISDLKRGKIQLFTVDSLINMLGKLDKPVSIIIDDRLAA